MIQFTPSKRMTQMQSSSTLEVLQKAEALRRTGKDVIDLGPGEPDFNTPDNVKQAAHRAIDENFTRYTPAAGTAELKQAICEYLFRQTGTRYSSSEVIASAGGKQTIFNAIVTLVDIGDEVLIPSPYWVTFPEVVIFAGATPVYIDTEPNAFKLTAEMVAEKLTPKTRLLIINSPNNPSGRIIDKTEFEQIVRLAAGRGIYVLSDECYYKFTYPPHEPFSAASLPEELRRYVLISGSLSKTYAMTGWRIGYALGRSEWIAEMVKLQSHSTSNPTSIAQKAAIEALTGQQDSIEMMLAEYGRRREYLISALNQIEGLECVLPEGAFYAFPSIKNLLNGKIKTSADFAQYLLDEAYVAVTPGSAFGTEGYIRISYATSLETLKKGVERIAECCHKLLYQ